MNVAFFTPHIKWPSHYETELELIQEHLSKGDQVIQLVCNAELPSCDINPTHDIQLCLNCMGCRDFGKKLIDGDYRQLSFLNLSAKDKKEIQEISTLKFPDVKALQQFKIENFDIGYAVASSIISQFRDPNPDLAKNAELVRNYLISSLALYRSTLALLKSTKIDRVYTFNGRLAHVKPVLRACQAVGVDCFIHERGNSIHHFELFENTTPHNIAYIEKRIRDYWDQEDPVIREDRGREFYNQRAKGVERLWFSFTKEQVAGLLPNNWDSSKNNIVIFNSSEDEFASVGEEWANPIYKTQLEGIKRIIEDVKDKTDLHVYLRVHPNLKFVKNADIEQLNQLKGYNFTLIPANSPISTYDLLRAASKVVSFGSTVGIEAVYWGKPSILAGKSFYYQMGGTYNATSHEHLISLLSVDLAPKPIQPALMYGNYLLSFGKPFQHYKAESFGEGKFKGEKVLDPQHIKYKFIDWLLWKPVVRNLRSEINNLHKKYLVNFKYK